MNDKTAAAWHKDPTGRHELRYWDGSEWTDHVSDSGTTGTDPVSGGAPSAEEPTPTAAATTTGPAGATAAASSAPVITAPVFWIVIAVIVIATFVGGALIAGGGDDGDSDAGPDIPDVADSDEESGTGDFAVPDEDDGGDDDGDRDGDAGEPDDLSVVDQGYGTIQDEFGTFNTTYAAIIENPNADTHLAQGVSVQFVFRDADGSVLDTEEAFVSSVLPGHRAAVSGTVSNDGELSEATSIDVEVDVGFWGETDLEGSIESSGVSTEESDFGLRTVGDVTSSFDEDLDFIEVTAIYRDPSGNILGGGFTTLDGLAAGGTRAFEIETFVTIPGVAETEIFATANVF